MEIVNTLDIDGTQWEITDTQARQDIAALRTSSDEKIEDLNVKLDGKADKNAVPKSLEITNEFGTTQVIHWIDGTHYRSYEDKSSDTYTDIVTDNGVAIITRTENGKQTKNAEIATMDRLNFVPSTNLSGGFKVVAYSDRTITGNSKLECLENWIKKAVAQYRSNIVVMGHIFSESYIDGFAIVNVWNDGTESILGASGTLVVQEGMYYYKTQNGVLGSGTLTKIN